MKKKLLVTFAVLTTLSLLTACGSSDKKEASQPNNEEETTSMIVVKPDSELADEMEEFEEDLYNPEEICALYYDYFYGLIPEAEYLETLEAVFETNPDDVKAIFEEHGEEYGYKIYEMSAEIQSSKVGDQIIQIGDVVVEFPCTVGELAELTGGELIDRTDAKDAYVAFKDIWLGPIYESLDTFGESYGHILMKTQDGSILYCSLLGNGELQKASELYIEKVVTGSNNVFLAGGLHNGLSKDDVDTLLTSVLGENMICSSWLLDSNHDTGHKYLMIAVSDNPDRDWQMWEPSDGTFGEVASVHTDTEGSSVYFLYAGFHTPYDEN